MEPILLGPLKIYPFGLIFAALLGCFLAGTAYVMKKNGLKRETVSWFALLSVPLGFAVSRLGFCLFAIDQIIGTQDYGMFFRVTDGGCLLWGGIAGVLLAAVFTGKITKQSGAAVSDSMIVPACLLILALRMLCGLLFKGFGVGLPLDYWFDPEETDFAFRYSVWPLEDYSFFERFPFAAPSYYDYWSWAVFVLQALWAGLTGFLVGSVLLFVDGDSKKAIQAVPWNVIWMVLGVGVLMNIVQLSGGVDLMVSALQTIITKNTASPIMGILAGVMSLFSSGLGVVFPTLIPTAGGLSAATGANAVSICAAIVIGGTIAGYTPISTAGALIMAGVAQQENAEERFPQNRIFVELFVISFIALALLAVLGFTGVYDIVVNMFA